MRILLYEYLTGGGLWSAGPTGPAEHPLLGEGRCIATAVNTDLTKIPGVELIQLVDARLAGEHVGTGTTVTVESSQDERALLVAWSAQVDGVILIAPECDRQLLQRCRWVERAGGRLLSPSASFVELTSDKSATAQRLAAHGVPVPLGIDLAPLEPVDSCLPEQFPYPAVLKPQDGVGSLDTYLVASTHDWPAAARTDRSWRLEQYCSGQPISISALCGPRRTTLLPPCRQHMHCDGTFHYEGGSYPLEPHLVGRACELARQTLSALPQPLGYIGIDMILGDEGSVTGDVVVEVNPRFTTSYIGLRQATSVNLAETMLSMARGGSRPLFFRAQQVQFDAVGCVTSAP